MYPQQLSVESLKNTDDEGVVGTVIKARLSYQNSKNLCDRWYLPVLHRLGIDNIETVER